MTKQKQIYKLAKRAGERAVTLIEILIVLAIVGLIAGGVAVVALPKFTEAQGKQAQTDTKAIYQAAETWKLDHQGCPTIEQMKKDGAFSATSNLKDPWGQPYKISCEEDGAKFFVASSGPNKRDENGDGDDIRIPKDKE